MQVLSVASECAPLVKTGGLADVVGALPSALVEQDVRMKILLPGYPKAMDALGETREVMVEDDLFGGQGRVLEARASGLDLLILDAPHLYDRPGTLYADASGKDWIDNPARFAALGWMAARIAHEGAGDWRPDLLHCHDWQAGFAPVYLAEMGPHCPTILTIHNIAFQGIAPAQSLGRLRLPESGFTPEGFEYYGRISSLKAGMVYSDKVTTVSPTYAVELLTPAFGMGLDGVLRARRHDLSGILNGIDEDVWDPENDPYAITYDGPRGKLKARDALEEEFGLPSGDGPLAIVVSRLTEQKGLDLLLNALPDFLERGGRLALLGTGDPTFEKAWTTAAESHPSVAVRIGYDEPQAHRMMAGGDAILVPSRFEPCGLTQLYGLRYGTVPVVARTGGLADTVIDANDAALKSNVATGIQFDPGDPIALANALDRLCTLFAEHKVWRRIQKNGIRHEVGWSASAAKYLELYRSLVPAL